MTNAPVKHIILYRISYGGISLMVFETIKTILSEQLEVNPDIITMDTNIADELGADSLDVVELLMSIEDEFDVEIPDEKIESLKTVGSVVDYIQEHMN